MKKLLFCLSVVCLLGLTGCYPSRMAYGGAEHDMATKKVKVIHNHFLIGGLIPLQSETHLGEIARKHPARVVTTKHSFLDQVFSIITGSIYSPTTTIVRVPE